MAVWASIPSIPGPPQNNGWFRVVDHAPKPSKGEVSVTVPYDSNSVRIFEACVRAKPIGRLIVFDEPHIEIAYTDSLVVGVQTSGREPTVLSFSVTYKSMEFSRASP